MTATGKRRSWRSLVNRSAQSVTLRRHRHHREWLGIMKECHALSIASAIRLNPRLKASRRTIERRFKLYKQEYSEGIPDDKKVSLGDMRNREKQIFTLEEEKRFAAHIRNIMSSGIEIVDKYWIRRESIKYYRGIRTPARNTRGNDVIPFTASDGWIDSFKKRNGFNKSAPKVVQRISAEKNGETIDHDHLQFNLCIEVMEAIQKYGLECVLNFDETPASVCEKPKSCWGNGTCDRMKIYSDANPKTKISLLPTIVADGTRLPLAWIHKGLTTKCLQGFFNIPKNVFSYFSANGWMNSELMIRYLREIIQPYLNGRAGALIMDSYAAHWTSDVQRVADKMKLELIKVPKGMTSECQPLDMTFNGPFKSARETLWKDERSEGFFITDNVERTVIRAAKGYLSVSDELISKGFADICPPFSDLIMHRYRPRHDGS